MTRIALALVLVAVLSGCAAEVTVVPEDLPTSDERRGLAGHRFASESVVIDGQAVPLIQFRGREDALVIGFGWSHIYASGCNEFTSGAWEVSEGRLVTGAEWSSSLRGCDERLNDLDQWLYEFLISSPFLARDGDTLVLSNGSSVITLYDTAGLNRPVRFSWAASSAATVGRPPARF